MTGALLYAYVLRKFIRTDKSTEAYEAMTDVIAEIRRVLLSQDFAQEAYITGITTLGDYRIAVPSDMGHLVGDITLIDADDDSSRGTLNKISKQSYDDKYGDRLLASTDNINLSTPKDFCIYAEQIYLGPVPDKITYKYQLNYTTEDYTEMASDTADVPFSDRYRNILRAGVLAELYDGLENYEEAGYWRNLYAAGIQQIEDKYNGDINDSEGLVYSGI